MNRETDKIISSMYAMSDAHNAIEKGKGDFRIQIASLDEEAHGAKTTMSGQGNKPSFLRAALVFIEAYLSMKQDMEIDDVFERIAIMHHLTKESGFIEAVAAPAARAKVQKDDDEA